MILQPRHIFLAVLMHVLLGVLLFTGVECSSPTIEAPPVVQGTLIKPSDIPKPSVPAQQAPTPPTPDALPDQGPQQKVVADTQGDEARIQQEKKEAQQKAELQKQAEQQAEQQKQADAEKQKRDEAAKQEELHQQEIALQKKKEQEQADEQKRQQEELKKQQAAAAADLQQQLAAEAQQQQSAMHERQKAEQAKRDAAERKRLAQEVQQAAGQEYGVVAKATWADQVGAAIHQAWSRPPGTDLTLKCKVRIEIASNGQVTSATIIVSSGNQLYDNSVISAIYKAAPLPLPDDLSLLQPIAFYFSPM